MRAPVTLAAAIVAALVFAPERFRAQDVVALPPPLEVSSGPVAPETQTYDQPVPEGLSPRNASYDIEVRLDPDTKSVTGLETLRWRNLSRNDATDLQFHLYWNAWRNDDSTWMRGRSLTGGARPRPDSWGRIDVTRLRIRDAEGDADLTAGRRFIAPDDENADDRTVMTVSLPRPVAPNGEIDVEIAWTAQVPRPFARTGFIGNYYFFGQWFPKIGVFEAAGWNTHQFHSVSEFYADFGVYDVRMTVPRGWVVGASGLEVNRTDNADGTTTHRYRGEDIIDFAWTTSPDFVEQRQTFTHPSLPPVDIRLLLQPDHVSQAERHFRATAAALRFYGEWFGPYPYEHITIVDPAYQSRSGGMEYPTLFTAGTGWLNPDLSPDPDEVTIHEVGHQWWYAVVATNEFEHAWMDEGINQFSDARTLEAAGLPDTLMYRFFGGFLPWVVPGVQLSRVDDGGGLARYQAQAEGDAQETPTYQYWPGSATATSYLKTNQWLMTLERELGWPAVRAILRTYFERWKFRHPRPDDFFAIANEVAGRDLTSFFDEVYRSSNAFDYGVQHFSSRRSGDGYRTVVVAQRLGEAVFPVEVLTTFDGGDTVRERWPGHERRRTFVYERSERAVSAEVDPDRVLTLDVNYTNNSRTTEPRAGEAGWKWALTWMLWLQDLMLTWAFFV